MSLLLLILFFTQVTFFISAKKEQLAQFTTFSEIISDGIRNHNMSTTQKAALLILKNLNGDWIQLTDQSGQKLWAYPEKEHYDKTFLNKEFKLSIPSVNGLLNLAISVPHLPSSIDLTIFAILTLSFTAILFWSIIGVLRRLSSDLSLELKKITSPHEEIFIDELETTRKDINKMKERITKEEENSKKLAVKASIGGFVSHIAHDLRSPLQTLSDAIKKIELCSESNSFHLAHTERAMLSIDKIKAMSEDLLNFNKSQTVNKSPIDITSFLKNVLDDVRIPATDKNIKLVLSPINFFSMNIDIPKMHRVFVNIILNAVQAISHNAGKIELKISTKNSFTITIKDNGSGIKEEHIPLIFDYLFTFGKPHGSGLGLAYCKNVIEAHNGTISVLSEINKGSSFIIELPISTVANIRPTEVINGLVDINSSDENNKKKGWFLMANTLELKREWNLLAQRNNTMISAEIEKIEDLLNKRIDYSKLDGAILDFSCENNELRVSDAPDIINFIRAKGIKNIRLRVSKKIPEPLMKRLITHDSTIVIQDTELSSCGTIFQ